MFDIDFPAKLVGDSCGFQLYVTMYTRYSRRRYNKIARYRDPLLLLNTDIILFLSYLHFSSLQRYGTGMRDRYRSMRIHYVIIYFLYDP